jgi:hypothetical protein
MESSMDEFQPGYGDESPVAMEINTNHRYKADEMGVIEFRIRNQGKGLIKSLNLLLNCPCEKSKTKSAVLKNLLPSSEKKPSFQFEPARGGEALLEVELSLEDEKRLPLVFRGQTSVTISSKNEGSSSHTSFTLDIHDIEKFMGNDLSELLGGVGKDKEIDAERLHQRMEGKAPFWMRVDLDFDEVETVQRRSALRHIIAPPSGQMPFRASKACLESLNPKTPRRAFFYSMPEVIFGREAQRSDAVLRFLPDFDNDPRSKTISAQQLAVRYHAGECTMGMAPNAHQLMSINHRLLTETEQVALAGAAEIKIGPCEMTLKVACMPRSEDPQWQRTREEILQSDPGSDLFEGSPWDLVGFSRPTNGQEEEYFWLLRKMEIGWEAGAAAGLQLGWPLKPRARLIFWSGRYYLEALGSESEIKTGNSVLPPGKIACLESETEIGFGPLRFMWRLF